MSTSLQRILTPELMDRDDVSPEELGRSLAYLRTVNRWLGGNGPIIKRLSQWTENWPAKKTIRILDVATGGADVPLSIAAWARQRGLNVSIVGLDRHAATIAWARENVKHEKSITLIQGDALDMPFGARSFDFVISSLFLHHLSDIQVMTVLAAMDRLADRGVIWSDLMRRRRAYWWIRALSLFANPVVRHDGPVSVLAGFSESEVLTMRDRLGLHHMKYDVHFGHRFTLSGLRG